MTLPVSSYEELLNRVRSLTQETRQLQQQLDTPVAVRDHNHNENLTNISSSWRDSHQAERSSTMPASDPPQLPDPNVLNSGGGAVLARLLSWPNKEEVTAAETKEQDERRTSPESTSLSPGEPQSAHKWAPTEFSLWHSVGPTTNKQTSSDEVTLGPRSYSQHQLGAKVEMVYSLLSMLGAQDKDEMSRTLLTMSSCPESCLALRQSGCLPLLVQLVHGGHESKSVRKCAAQALHNLVHCHTDDKRGRREARVLRLVEQIQEYCGSITSPQPPEQDDPHPGVAIAALMKLSFDEEHRHAMCQLGALQAIASLIQIDNEVHGSDSSNATCVTVRRYAGMALTNLTFGDCNNKALLCSMRGFLAALVAQLQSPSEDLRQVTASVLRNLSWRADTHSKQALRQVDACTALMLTSMAVKKESTMKSILSALWNLSAHCNLNKADICAVDGALQYLVEMLRFQDAPSKTLAIVENAGGILRNISSHIAVREDYRQVLREHNCIPLLLQQLKSASLTVVSNACGTLWNLSARCTQDQRTLWELGAVPMLRSLVHSKHKMISMGSSAALKNLLAAMPEADIMDRSSKGLPTLQLRKRRALEQDLDSNLAETCDNIESVERWDSRESVTSTQSDNLFDRNRSLSHRSGSLQLAPPRRIKEADEKPKPEALIERLTLEESSTTTEQPVNYSLKYSEQDQPPISEKPVNYSLKYSEDEKPTSDCGDRERGVFDTSEQDYAETDLDQPTDYSLKYRESNEAGDQYEDNQTTEEKGSANVYAETDLDQPTDYSLRYAEEEPEKPQTYCTEGTPYNFSTATSLSDLRSPDTTNKSLEAKSGGLSPVGSLSNDDNIGNVNVPIPNQIKEETKEGKVVTFETPMMFSRCSSLGSLSSCEPPDDRSSVVSEFSRMTSGMVSPSELPDSPTQTVPPSPRNIKPPVAIPAVKPVSVFEERVSVFKEESTPVQFSTATSLSDLTFDDDHPMDGLSKCDLQAVPDPTSELPPVDEEEDEDMLAACINIGMQNSNRRSVDKPVVHCAPSQRSSGIPRVTGIPVKNHFQPKTPPKLSHLPESEVTGDWTTVFRTEDTPANISHATSRSDLSNLCGLSDDSDHDNILAECIQSGMPQARLPPASSHIKKPVKVATVAPMQVKTSLLPRRQPQSPPIPISGKNNQSDLAQDNYMDNIIQTSSKSERCRQMSPAPDDQSSPLSSLDPDMEEAVTVMSRQASLGSLSEDQVTISDQQLLEQCISSGMPKTKNVINPSAGTHTDLADEDAKVGGQSESSEVVVRDIMKESDTWNEDNSPSFPSISLTAPLITSYKSLEQDIKPDSLTDSRVIYLQSGKVGLISHLEMEASFTSLDLEHVRPPSCMGSLLSLTTSVSEADKRRNTGPRSLTLLQRRTAHDSGNSLSWNNLDSIKPPSGMDEVMELENSILSCASLMSEIADSPHLSPTNSMSEDVTLADTEVTSETEQPTSLTPRLTPKMKRQMLKDRFNTYTITGDKSSRDSSLDAETNLESEVVEPLKEIPEPCSPNKTKRTTPKQRRLADKERFRTRTLGDQQIPVPLSPREKRLADKDRFRTQTLEGPITTETLPEITTPVVNGVSSEASALQENESDYDKEELSDDEKPKPIVVKPTEIKSIRGRKKIRSGIPVVNRSPAKKSKSPKPVEKPVVLQRQGTFTKDEPQAIPVASGIPVFSNTKKQIPPPKAGLKKKIISTPPASATPQTKKVTPQVMASNVGRGRTGSLPRSDPPQKASGVRSSKSNQSLKSETLGSNTSLSSGGARWNSNSSLNTPGTKKEPSSKIASLWKKVEDSKKKKDAEGKDKRIWIGPNNTPPHSRQRPHLKTRRRPLMKLRPLSSLCSGLPPYSSLYSSPSP